LLVIIINATNSGAMTPFYLIFSNIKRVLITPMDNLFTSDEIGLNILVYSFAFYFIMGALIGFIYGKIKSRNKSTTAKLPHN